MKPRSIIAAIALSALSAPLAAESAATNFQTPSAQSETISDLSQFAPAANRKEHRIDYEFLDDALGWLVIPMGPSIREGAPRVTPGTGTRFIYGHTSRYRLEGNRVAFSHFDSQKMSTLTEYRLDLERIGTELDLTTLPRNEQLAFWLNLHNVAVIEALAANYPLRDPSEGPFGANEAGLQDAKLVTVRGVALSPRDIRERIVFANWKDPKVMYGFWRGEIGGPSIQRLAFTGSNVDQLLALSAEEFVNSLRGVEGFNGKLRVSRIFEEAQPFFFSQEADLRSHLTQFANDDVKSLMAKYDSTAFNRYETDIADLVFGRADPGLNFVCPSNNFGHPTTSGSNINSATSCQDQATRPNRAAARLMKERQEKLVKAYKRGIRSGTVIYGDGAYPDGEGAKEVE